MFYVKKEQSFLQIKIKTWPFTNNYKLHLMMYVTLSLLSTINSMRKKFCNFWIVMVKTFNWILENP